MSKVCLSCGPCCSVDTGFRDGSGGDGDVELRRDEDEDEDNGSGSERGSGMRKNCDGLRGLKVDWVEVGNFFVGLFVIYCYLVWIVILY